MSDLDGEVGSEAQASGEAGMNRRNLIKAGAAVGAAAWVAPQVISMSAAAAASVIVPPTCVPVPYAANFNGLDSNIGAGDFKPYGPGVVALTDGWTTTAATTSIDAVTHGAYGTGSFTNPSAAYPTGGSTSVPVIIDLAGTPGPGGITTALTLCPLTKYTIAFQRLINDGGTFTLDITDQSTQSYSGAAFASESFSFTTTSTTAVTVTFATSPSNTGNGNEFVGNITIL